ncbi:potassium transporter Kef [Microbacterium sp. LMI1x-1-1.1]|uniref:potassium transporter Kef n=1 Tax=Microbacterium sp. LMI1x-1-1.1 TaxID=3135246 RepID=UPI0034241B3F
MIRRPGHLAAPPPSAPMPHVEGLDIDLAARNTAAAGGDPARFAASFAAGFAAASDVDAVDLAGVAAWRAGALAFRDDALQRLARLSQTHPDAAAAALGLDSADLDAFLEAQRDDRFWWPGRAASRGYVCAVGGFAGLGGAWIAPPVEAAPLGDPGAFGVRTGEQWWRLDADAWGSRLRALDAAPEAAAGGAASIVLFPDSYLAWVHVRDAA